MMLDVTYDIQGEEGLRRATAAFSESLRDLTPVWPEVAEVFYRIEAEQFATEGGHSGQEWRELSRGYEQYKTLKHPGKSILEVTGALRDSLTDPNDPNHVTDMRADSLTIGATLAYAKYHQRGTERLPQRKIFDLTDRDKADLLSAARRELAAAARDLGFEVISFEGFV